MSMEELRQEPPPVEPKVSPLRPASINRKRRASSVTILRDFQPHALAIEETPPSPFTRIMLWSLVTLLVTAVVWSSVSHIPIMTTAPGKFVTDAHTKVVQSLNTGTVKNILVRPGDAVVKGQILVNLDPKVNLAKVDSTGRDLGFNSLQQRRIHDELSGRPDSVSTPGVTPEMMALERRLAAAQLSALRSKIDVDDAQLREARANLAAGNATLDEYVKKEAADADIAHSAAPLVAAGALSGVQYSQLEDQLIVDEGQLMAQRQQIEQLAAALTAAQRQREEDKRTFAAERYQDLESAAAKSYDLTSQYAAATRDADLDHLSAPGNGTVQSVDVGSLGTVVQAGQTVATIVPSDAPVVVEVDLPSEEIGFVKVGQKTQIKVTAYPFEEYGSITGTVLWVSPTADSTSDLASLPEGDSHQPVTPPPQSPPQAGTDETKGPAPPTLYYRVKVQPQQLWLDAEGQRRMMRPGMTASVDIETGQRRVLDFFLDPVMKYISNGITVH
jgi:hemolysin D